MSQVQNHYQTIKIMTECSSVDTDIKLFFNTHLTNIVKHWSDGDFIEGWPSSSDINILCEKAAGLFIYASMVIKFVASQHHQPSERLALLVSVPQNTNCEGGSGLDTLYTEVLIQAFHGVDFDNLEDQVVFYCLRSAIGVVLLVFNLLPMKALSTLLGTSNISISLHSLHSLLFIPDSIEDPICAFHKSFSDFLINPEWCKDKRFFVDPPVHHTELLLPHLNLMKKMLSRWWYILHYHRSTLLLPLREKVVVVDGRVEERSEVIYWYRRDMVIYYK